VTLLELVLVILLLGILSAIIVAPVMTGARAWTEMSSQKEAVQQARIGLERLVRELRAVQRVNGRPAIAAMGPTSIRFTRATAGGNEDELEYSWAGAGQPLVRTVWDGVVATPDNAAMSVGNFALRYYEDSNAELTAADVREEAEDQAITCVTGPCVTGGLVVLDEPGELVTFDFTGTGVVWIGPKDDDLGIASVLIDGAPADPPTQDQYASVAVPLQPLFSSPRLAYATHTIAIGYTGTQHPSAPPGAAVTVDAFDRVVSRVVIELNVQLTIGDRTISTPLRDQVSFRRLE
jgi:type II secretory pathway pseudopilin PulG